MWRTLLLSLCLSTPGATALGEAADTAPSPPYRVRWTQDQTDANKTVAELSGIDSTTLAQLRSPKWKLADWQRLFPVFVEQSDLLSNIGLPPMLGTYQIESDLIRFEPQFPLEPGLIYRAVFLPSELPGHRTRSPDRIAVPFKCPPRLPSQPTVVAQVYPTSDVLPENLLKFYLQFSAPMSRGRIYDHIHLRTDSGTEIELPFLEIDEELWNREMTRLTLFIDPGRIKRGVRPLEEIGPALEHGKRYSLVIDSAWKDASGNPLGKHFAKQFTVSLPDRESPDPARWKITPPRANSKDPLVIEFREPLDWALAQRMIQVLDPLDRPIDGKVTLADQERQWRFQSDKPWVRGRYQLVVQTTIEDLAGNNIGKAFDVDLFERVEKALTKQSVKLPLEVR